jgi:excisionase family DNA binding protein
MYSSRPGCGPSTKRILRARLPRVTPSRDDAQEWDVGPARVIDLDADPDALPVGGAWFGFRRDELLTKPEYLTKAQAGEIVQLHPKTIERAILAGELRAYRLRGKVRISREDLEAWVAENEIEPVPDLHDI